MSDDTHPLKTNGHGDYERRDIGVSAVFYFLAGLAVALVVSYFAVSAFYNFLEKRSQAEQAPVSPLVANAPADTRKLPQEYKTDSAGADYEKYLHKNFPEPQLETNERTELNDIRLREANLLSTYDYVDKDAGTVRIPINRAMELLVQRGLPVREQTSGEHSNAQPRPKEKKQ